MALRTLKALWASGDKFPITTLEFVLNLGWHSNSCEQLREVKHLYYALSKEDITLDGQLYTASCFSVALPERSDNTFQNLTFSIGDVNEEICNYLSYTIGTNQKNTNNVILRQFHPETFEKQYEFELTITSVSFKKGVAQFTASFADMVNTEFPKLRYTSENAPGILYVSSK